MREILDFLHSVIDEKADIMLWDAKQHLNLQLAGSYEYYLVNALGKVFLIICPHEDFTIMQYKRHISLILEKTGYEATVLLFEPTAYKVKKMLEERIAFFTLDKQMYLPFLALNIKRNRSWEMEIQHKIKFTAATQLVFLYVLYSEKNRFETEELCKKLNLSAMTVLRAMNELKQMGIIKQEISGLTKRKKIYIPIERKEFYNIGKGYLINPVSKKIYVSYIPETIRVYKAGLTALAEQSMLGEPANEVNAVCVKQSELIKYQVTKAQALLEQMPEVQFMKYDVGKLTDNQYIDPVSLIMSLEIREDRVEIAIDEMMEGTIWYEE